MCPSICWVWPLPLATLTHPLSFQPRRRLLLYSPLRTSSWQGALREYRYLCSWCPSMEPGRGLSPVFVGGVGQLLVPAGSELCWGLCLLAQVGAEFAGLEARAGTKVDKLGVAVMGMTGRCKLHPYSSQLLCSPVWVELGQVPQAWGLGLGFSHYI